MSAEAHNHPRPDFAKFTGGQRALAIALVLGVLGLVATFALSFVEGKTVALYAYLVAFAYWLGLGLGSLILLMIFHAAKGRWMTVVRRVVEVMAGSLAIFPLLFVPVVFGLRDLYPWVGGPESTTDAETAHLFHHREVYLNVPFFLARAAVYFLVWVIFSQLFLRWSTRQDETGAAEYTRKAWRLGPGGLPVVGLALTFAAIDWLMSLGTLWFSSIWGVYYFAGSFVATFALLIILVLNLNGTPALQGAVKTAHWLNLGKFLLAFTCFWAYIAYSQYMLTWVANLPDTVPWIKQRQLHGWHAVGIGLIVGHFVVPFILLLSRALKMKPARLALVAFWILIIHYVDLYWVVMPQIRPEQPLVALSNLTALVGVGGIAFAFGVWLLRGRHAVPVGDPFLDESLSYSRMM